MHSFVDLFLNLDKIKLSNIILLKMLVYLINIVCSIQKNYEFCIYKKYN